MTVQRPGNDPILLTASENRATLSHILVRLDHQTGDHLKLGCWFGRLLLAGFKGGDAGLLAG
jgi:hypothetical protein